MKSKVTVMVVLLSEGSCLFASEADAFESARKAHVTH
jgi:hypothetical protein